jgi:mRNA interferase MazF
MTKHKIVLIPFPFDDLSGMKLRPALCLTDPIGTHRHVVLAFITSRIPDELLETDLVLDTTQANFEATGLRVASTIRMHRLVTLTTAFIKRELGELPPTVRRQVSAKLKRLFALTEP